MTSIPSGPSGTPSPGERQQRAEQLKAEMEASTQQATQTPTEESAQPESEGAGPVGQGNYEVKQGDCISSIAKDTGHFWETIWNDPANAELKEVRKDPNVLLAGDRVTIPETTPKEETGETELRHGFVRRGEPALFRIRVLRDDKPRANEPFSVEIDGKEVCSGATAPDGMVAFPIPGNTGKGVLRIGDGDDEEVIQLAFGNLDPITETRGVQQRLLNLGYPCGPCDGVLGERSRAAVKSFQRDSGLDETGLPDENTRSKLREVYGT